MKSSLSLKLELLWWGFTALLIYGVLYPIFQKISNYPFLVINIIFIIIFITFTRYIFLLKYTFLAHQKVYKAALIAISVPLLFYLINQMNIFHAFAGEEGLDSFMAHLPFGQKKPLMKYIRNEMVLFGMGSIIATVLLPFRMTMSIWRNHNKGTV